MKLKTTGVSAHPWIFAAQQLIERQSQFFGRKIPTCLVDGLFKGQRHPFNVATARPPDSVNKASGYLAFKARPSLFAKDAFNFAEPGKWMKQARQESQTDLTTIGLQFERDVVRFGAAN